MAKRIEQIGERHMERSRVMKRLTIDLSESGIDDIGYSNPNDPYGMYDILDLARLSECDDGTCASILIEISNKLSAYENTVLTPSEIEQLKKENAELKARLEKAVELPCEVGDSVQATVNRPYNGHDAIIRGAVTDVKLVVRVKYNSCRFINFLASDFGKTVFLTQEAAEQALKEREENEM